MNPNVQILPAGYEDELLFGTHRFLDLKISTDCNNDDGDSSSNAYVTPKHYEWAELMDANEPVTDFHKIIPNPAHRFWFKLDNFQEQAIIKMEEGNHVLVAAHTSAGKTAVAEYAIALARRNFNRVLYTSPIKALSNQKHREFSKTFGDVGLITGDTQTNVEASCLVMTTEILLAMLYRGDDVMTDVEFVILDEIHYVNNAERGRVWEEVLILLPRHVKLVMLSATVPNALEFADWVGRTSRRRVYVVQTKKRPVPLCHYLYTGIGGDAKKELFLVLDQHEKFQHSGYSEALKRVMINKKRMVQKSVPEMNKWVALINHLKKKDKLPVIVFSLSRLRCDKIAKTLPLDMTSEEEKVHVKSLIDHYLQILEKSQREMPQVTWLQRCLLNGIGVHHSGVVSILKELVEILFLNGHVKVLFATESFGLGVNMPARSVVFDGIGKYDSIRWRTLLPAEYIQMAGRAGRRGLDKTGTVIIMCNEIFPYEYTLEKMMMGSPQPLSSQFRLTYSTLLKSMRSPTISVTDMMERSFRMANRGPVVDCHREMFELAKKEYEDKFSEPLAEHLKPLATFFDRAAAYIDVLSDVMPRLLGQKEVMCELVPGRVVVFSQGPYINQLGILLNTQDSPYQVFALNTAEQETNYGLDDNWYRMLGLSAQYDYLGTEDKTMDYTILSIAPKNIIAVTQMTLKLDPKSIIRDWENRRTSRDAPLPSSCVRLVRSLQRLSSSVRRRPGAQLERLSRLGCVRLAPLSISDDRKLWEDFQHMHTLQAEIAAAKSATDLPNYKTEFAIVYEHKQCERTRDKYKRLINVEGTALYSDYQNRLRVLRELKYIDEKDSVILKGHVACAVESTGLIISELICRNVFADNDPAEIAALLSGFVFRTKAKEQSSLPDSLLHSIHKIINIDAEIRGLEYECQVQRFRYDPWNFGLVRVVYEWAQGKPLIEIFKKTKVQEGLIVGCIQQLYELLVGVRSAAEISGDMELQRKVTVASTAIRRDIVWSTSLHIKNAL